MSDVISGATNSTLAIIGATRLPTILAADENDILGRLKAELAAFEPDASTEKGRKEIASKAHKVARAKMDLVRLAGTLKEDAQSRIKAINAEVREIEERMDALKIQIRRPLDEYEAREEARVHSHQQALRQIEHGAEVSVFATSTDIEAQLIKFDGSDLLTRDWQEFAERAAKVIAATRNALRAALADAQRAEAEAAEAERRRAEIAEQRRQQEQRAREEREAEIARQAAEQARADAERRAREKQEALERAHRAEQERLQHEKDEAERRAQAQREAAARREQEARDAAERSERRRVESERRAEEQRIAAEQQREADRIAAQQREERGRLEAADAERRRIAAQQEATRREEARRAADREHRAKINRGVLIDLVACGASEDVARLIVAAIAHERVAHVHIQY